jgi:hypothetical protein
LTFAASVGAIAFAFAPTFPVVIGPSPHQFDVPCEKSASVRTFSGPMPGIRVVPGGGVVVAARQDAVHARQRRPEIVGIGYCLVEHEIRGGDLSVLEA